MYIARGGRLISKAPASSEAVTLVCRSHWESGLCGGSVQTLPQAVHKLLASCEFLATLLAEKSALAWGEESPSQGSPMELGGLGAPELTPVFVTD